MPQSYISRKDPEKSDVLLNLFCFGLVASGAVAALVVDTFILTPIFSRGEQDKEENST